MLGNLYQCIPSFGVACFSYQCSIPRSGVYIIIGDQSLTRRQKPMSN